MPDLPKRHGLWPIQPEAMVLAAIALAVAYQILCEPIVGMANNADFARVISPAGLGYETRAEYWSTVFRFLKLKFTFTSPVPFRYLTSEKLILEPALVLNRLFSKDGWFDIRAMGVCHGVLYLVAIAVFLRAARARRAASRVVVPLFALFAFSDVKYVAYFNTFYAEAASLIFLVATVGFGFLCLATESTSSRGKWMRWLGYMISATLFWTAKAQNIAFAPSLAVGAWYLYPRREQRWGRIAAAAVLPVGMMLAIVANAYGDTVTINAQTMVDEEIIPNSATPEADRQELMGPHRTPPSLGRVVRFYLLHPARWWAAARRHSADTFSHLPYGQFTRESGFPANSESKAFSWWGGFRETHYPRNLAVFIAFFAATLGVTIARYVGSKARGWSIPAFAYLAPVLAVGCALEYATTITCDGNAPVKHFFIFNAAAELAALSAVCDLLDWAGQAIERRQSRAVTPQAT